MKNHIGVLERKMIFFIYQTMLYWNTKWFSLFTKLCILFPINSNLCPPNFANVSNIAGSIRFTFHLYFDHYCVKVALNNSKHSTFIISAINRMSLSISFLLLGFIPCKGKQPLRGIELQESKHEKKDYRIQKICLERTYS